jgi:hypothetical protein
MTLKTVTKEIRNYSIPELAPDAFFEWIEQQLAEVPVPRSQVRIGIDTGCEYGSEYAFLGFTYQREETAGEIAERQKRQERREITEKAQLARLKAKYG